MTAILSHIKSFAVLFLVLTLLVSMVPRQQFEKYIRFFAGMVLILITISPLKGGLNFQEQAGILFEEFSDFWEKQQAGEVLGFLYPVLNGIFGSEDFFKLLDYETFSEELEQLTLDTRKLSFLHNDYYLTQYEDAVAADVQNKVKEYGYPVDTVNVELSEDYTIKRISVVLKEDGEEIIIGKILLSEEEQEQGWDEKRELTKILSEYYGVEDDKIAIVRSAE